MSTGRQSSAWKHLRGTQVSHLDEFDIDDPNLVAPRRLPLGTKYRPVRWREQEPQSEPKPAVAGKRPGSTSMSLAPRPVK